jgi:hypothetical protein
MPEFLVERYVPSLDAEKLATIGARLARAAEELAGAGREIRWLHSVGLADEDTCLCLFRAASEDDVVAVNERAGVGYEHVVSVLSAGPSPGRRPGGHPS